MRRVRAVLKVWRRHDIQLGQAVLGLLLVGFVNLLGKHGCWKLFGAAMRMCWDRGATRAQLHEAVDYQANLYPNVDREYRQAIEEEERRS